jgi:hypothetical protein
MNEEQQTQEAVAQEVYPLDDAAIGIIAEIDQQMMPLNAMLQGALSLFVRQHKLQGRWQIAPGRKELVKVSQ